MTTPYFYIIEHVSSRKYYAGVRWAYGCDPSELLTEKGYHTSSDTVNNMIADQGLSAFVIRKIKTFDDDEQLRAFETRFLKRVNAAVNDRFLNRHNNEKVSFGTSEFKNAMVKKHGVEHSMHDPESKKLMIQTTIERHGAVGYQNPHVKEKANEGLVEKFGSIEEAGRYCRKKADATMLERHGVTNPSQVPEFNEKKKETYKRKNHSKGKKNSQYGTKWVTDGITVKKIYSNELASYLADGWTQGRKKASIKSTLFIQLEYHLAI